MIYYLPMTKANYNRLKASPHYVTGGYTYSELRSMGYSETVFVLNGELHASNVSSREDIAAIGDGNSAQLYTVKFKLRSHK